MPAAPGIYAAVGSPALALRFLAALGPALRHGTRLFWIDAENSFDAYGSSYAARSRGWDPRPLLERVRLARPFNLFQLETMVRRKLPPIWRGEPVVVSDPAPMFYDEDVPAADAARVAASVLQGMRALPAVWMVLSGGRPVPSGREAWSEGLLRSARGQGRRPSAPAAIGKCGGGEGRAVARLQVPPLLRGVQPGGRPSPGRFGDCGNAGD